MVVGLVLDNIINTTFTIILPSHDQSPCMKKLLYMVMHAAGFVRWWIHDCNYYQCLHKLSLSRLFSLSLVR